MPDAARRPGYDIIVQALSGLMSVTGEPDGEPVKAGVALLDVITGLQAAIGILAALHERARTGRGRHVSVSLFDAGVAAMVNQAANHLIGGVVAGPMGTAHPNICPYQAFHASDRPFIVAAGNDRLFRPTCEVVGHPEWADDPRFATNEERVRHRDELIPLLADVFATKTADEWIEALEAASVPCAPIRSMDEVFASPEGAALVESVDDPERATTLRLLRNPIRFDGRPSTRGGLPRSSANTRTRSWARRDGDRAMGRAARRAGRSRRDPRRGAGVPLRLPHGALPDQGRAGRTSPARRRRPPQRALERLPEGGRVLDVGCGGGATLPPARRPRGRPRRRGRAGGHARGVPRERAGGRRRGRGRSRTMARCRRPRSAPVDVAVAGHVLYNVADLEPFARQSRGHRPAPRRLRAHRASPPALDERSLAPVPWPRTPRRAASQDALDALAELELDARIERW